MSQKIKNVLISLSDKSGIESVLKVLHEYKINIISSGGTYKEIKKLGYKCTEISKYTKFREMLSGRVKTLHPKIHAGILSDRSNKKHQNEMVKNKFKNIDLIIVNFYPFQKSVLKTKNSKNIIENIDIGGPTMVRAAAKNFRDVLIITGKKDYSALVNELQKHKGGTSLQFREYMASKAFGLTAYYDSMIASWFNKKLNITFPDRKIIFGKKLTQLRYGENPHQKSSIYVSDFNDQETGLKKISGKDLSYNNYNDIFTGLEILASFKKSGTVIIKHANPSGASINKSPIKSFQESLSCDPISAFGGVVACNFEIDKKIAKKMSSIFFEVILARGFNKEALKILRSKKNLRLIDSSKFKYKKNYQIKYFDASFLLQEKNQKVFDVKKLKFVTKLKPTKKELRYAQFAFNICKFVKSNSIVISNNFSTVGIGAGQPSRVDSCKIAVQKAHKFQPKKLKNSVAASDAFFPFSDGIKKLIKAGVKLIIQPGGSIRDDETIRVANKAKIKMIFTDIRHFNH
jgi:phosphoribosylaminoimidazolecarboxamide formyltransferase/IMP cyclohydrolase